MGLHKRTEKTHSPDGSPTISERERRGRAMYDSQPMTSRCGLEGCGWVFSGTAREAREQAAMHRLHRHPLAGKLA